MRLCRWVGAGSMRRAVGWKLCQFVVAAAYALTASLAVAGDFKVSPLGLDFDQNTTTGVLKITNQDAQAVTVQLSASKWVQPDNGQDKYLPTDDIIFFPKIIEIAPGTEQVIRVGFQAGKKPPEKEQSYRLFIDELPVGEPGKLAMKFALRMSIPVFVAPAQQEKTKVVIEDGRVENGHVRMSIRNSGNVHLMVKTVKATVLGMRADRLHEAEVNGWYLLGGSRRSFDLPMPGDVCRKAGSIQVEASIEAEVYRLEIPADEGACALSDHDKTRQQGS